MSPTQRYAKKKAKARQRRRLKAQERLERDRRQAQRAAEALQHALEDVGLPAEHLEPLLQHLLSYDRDMVYPRIFSTDLNNLIIIQSDQRD